MKDRIDVPINGLLSYNGQLYQVFERMDLKCTECSFKSNPKWDIGGCRGVKCLMDANSSENQARVRRDGKRAGFKKVEIMIL